MLYTDNEGNEWKHFNVDYGAGEMDGECVDCDATLVEGGLCLEGGDEVCGTHLPPSGA